MVVMSVLNNGNPWRMPAESTGKRAQAAGKRWLKTSWQAISVAPRRGLIGVICLILGVQSATSLAAVPVQEALGAEAKAAASASTRQRAETEQAAAYLDAEDEALWAPAYSRVQSQVPTPSNTRAPGGASTGADSSSAASLQQMFIQMQILQQQVKQMSGRLEEQGYLLQKLQSQQREHYLDLDRRVAALGVGKVIAKSPNLGLDTVGESVIGVAAESALAQVDEGGVDAANAGGAENSAPTQPKTEREAYVLAIGMLRERQFESSAAAFEQIIVQYPNGQYTPNAFYWLGELYLALEDQERARQNFVQVIRLYPDHQKVPDALYKLGVLYHALGDTAQAKKYLAQVQSEYPQSSAAGLAQKYSEAIE